MGLLDEAIREHLQLRRRHGVDPAVVAREEHDALSPVEREERAERSSVSAGLAVESEADVGASELACAPAAVPFDVELVADGATHSGGETSQPGDVSFMEATAEIDMRTVLGELEHAMSAQEAGGEARVGRAVRAENAAPVAAGGVRASFDFEADEDPLAWETAAPRVRRVTRGDGGRDAGGESSLGAAGS